MPLKSNKGFSLLEVIVAIAILSTAIVVVMRAFTSVISAVKVSQNITFACFFAEDKLWKLENAFALEESNEQDSKFSYAYELTDTDVPELKALKLKVSWDEKRSNPYSLDFYTITFK